MNYKYTDGHYVTDDGKAFAKRKEAAAYCEMAGRAFEEEAEALQVIAVEPAAWNLAALNLLEAEEWSSFILIVAKRGDVEPGVLFKPDDGNQTISPVMMLAAAREVALARLTLGRINEQLVSLLQNQDDDDGGDTDGEP